MVSPPLLHFTPCNRPITFHEFKADNDEEEEDDDDDDDDDDLALSTESPAHNQCKQAATHFNLTTEPPLPDIPLPSKSM